MVMRLFQKYGHTPIILIGTGTTRIGDPSGKDETRKMLTEDEIKIMLIILKLFLTNICRLRMKRIRR